MSVLDNERRDTPRQGVIDCRVNRSDSTDKGWQRRMTASVRGDRERLRRPAMRSVETGRRPRVSRFQIRFSEGDAEYAAGKEEENQGEETFGQEETVLRNSLSEWQIIP